MGAVLKTCRQAGYHEHALYVAEQAGESESYLSILLEDMQGHDKALGYLQSLPGAEAQVGGEEGGARTGGGGGGGARVLDPRGRPQAQRPVLAGSAAALALRRRGAPLGPCAAAPTPLFRCAPPPVGI